MTLNVPLERLDDRRRCWRDLDRLNRQVDSSGAMEAMDEFGRRAVEMVLGGTVRRALDLASEDPRVVERYDTKPVHDGLAHEEPNARSASAC